MEFDENGSEAVKLAVNLTILNRQIWTTAGFVTSFFVWFW